MECESHGDVVKCVVHPRTDGSWPQQLDGQDTCYPIADSVDHL